MNKDYYIIIDGEKITVTEEVYRAFKRPVWAERKRRAVRRERECSLDALTENGFEAASRDALVDEIVADRLILEQLFAALSELTGDERALIDALYFKEKSEREYAAESGVPHPTVHSRKNAVLKKLKTLLDKL